MQGKGVVKMFLILLAAVCIYQYLLIYPTTKVEKKAKSYETAMMDKYPESEQDFYAKYLDSISNDEVFRIPLIKSFTYNDLKKSQLGFGLDLQGGMSAILQVDLKDMLINLAGAKSKDENFAKALENAEEAQKNSQSDFITLFGEAYRDLGAKKPLARLFLNKAMGDEINAETSDGEVIQMLRAKGDETVQLTFNMLKQRIDKLGVVQPNVSLDAARDLIVVEMPGIRNAQRARDILQSEANLEFWHTFRASDNNYDISNRLNRIDNILKGGQVNEEPQVEFDTLMNISIDTLTGQPDTSYQYIPKDNSAVSNAGPLLSLLELNTGSALYPRTVIGLAERKDKNAIDALLTKDEVKNEMSGMDFRWSAKPFVDAEGNVTDRYYLYAIKKLRPGATSAPLEGDHVTNADVSTDPATNETEVTLRMDSKGAKIWAEMTTYAYNNEGREIAIVLDDEVYSAPSVNNGPITGGNSSISGGFTVAEANDLSKILEIGKLPATPRIIQEAFVGPSLGKENIDRSLNSLLFGFGLLLLFMLIYYGGAGLVSIIALLLNLFFIFGALASIGTVLTLPGLAGIVLTIGMAVDANVIIFERVREELRSGKTVLASVADGFKYSWSAIIDANVTTFLVAGVLAYYGLGPIKGFAVVLMVGVISSLLTAVLFGKLLIDWWLRKEKPLSFWTGMSKNVLANLTIDWIGKRKIAYVVSGILIVAGLASLFTKGLDLGVDFKGGYNYTVQFDGEKKVSRDELATGLETTLGGEGLVVKSVDSDNTYSITTSYLIDEQGRDVQDRVTAKVHEGINALVGGNLSIDDFKDTGAAGKTHITSTNKIGPTIADDIKKSSYWAGFFALLLIFLYILIRFNKWQFSLGAVAALFHDSLIVLGLFSILHGVVPFSLEVDQAFIAAILTVIGYSINDTVVVFDRIREFFDIYSGKSKDEVINMAINRTFSRTVITSLTTLLVVGTLFLFGGSSIKGFAFALLIGILVGTYSSIFVATPIVRDMTGDDFNTSSKEDKQNSFSKAY